jgi:hypothetical protein
MFKKIISFFLVFIISSFVFSFGVDAATLTCADSLNGKAILSEFSSAATAEWVELLNTDQDNSINLSNCALKDGSNNVIKSLSGTLPRGGFLTFNLDTASLVDTGGIIRLTDASGTSLSAISYGTDTSITTITAPSSSQTGYYNLSTVSWATGDPTKGWCNLGTSGCPTIATIVSGMNSSGVKTNLAEMTDYSRVSGLYFQKSETNDPEGTAIGKISFLSEMNFTDQDALSWMQDLGSNIDMSTKGTIGLNADLIKNLTATNATLTMYGLSLSNPEVLVDGATDTGGVVSGLSYSGGNLTFTAAHFTTFKAQERSTSSGTSSPTTPGCDNQAPDHSPDLFQIDTSKNNAKLFFTPVNNAVDQYYIAYGFTEGDERFGVKFDKGYYNGVIDYTINELAPNTNYYFRVRAGNGCATGSWSNWLRAKTDNVFTQAVIDDPQATVSANKISEETKETIVEPTKSVESPTLGVSDFIPTQPQPKKSWMDRLRVPSQI